MTREISMKKKIMAEVFSMFMMTTNNKKGKKKVIEAGASIGWPCY